MYVYICNYVATFKKKRKEATVNKGRRKMELCFPNKLPCHLSVKFNGCRLSQGTNWNTYESSEDTLLKLKHQGTNWNQTQTYEMKRLWKGFNLQFWMWDLYLNTREIIIPGDRAKEHTNIVHFNTKIVPKVNT